MLPRTPVWVVFRPMAALYTMLLCAVPWKEMPASVLPEKVFWGIMDASVPPMMLEWALPSTNSPLRPLGIRLEPLVLRPTMLGSTVTPVASPPRWIPLPKFPEATLVRRRLFPPVEVTKIPSSPLGAATPKANRPAKVLKETKPET